MASVKKRSARVKRIGRTICYKVLLSREERDALESEAQRLGEPAALVLRRWIRTLMPNAAE